MESRNIWSFALLLFFFTFVTAATTKKPAAARKETFKIALHLSSGVTDAPTWVLEADQPLPDNIIKRIRRLDDHGDHAGHGAHAGHGQTKKKLSNLNGYKGLTIEHTEISGYTHTMTLPRCDEPFLEWDLIAKTYPKSKGKYPTSTSTLAYIKKLLQTCVLKKRAADAAAKKAAAASTKTTANDAGKETNSKPSHTHASHAH